MIQKKFGTILFSDSRCQKQTNELQLDKTGMKKKIDIIFFNKEVANWL